MTRWMRQFGLFAATVLLLAALMSLINYLQLQTLAAPAPGQLLAYKALTQPTNYQHVDNHSCTANRLTALAHPFIENTAPAITQAFALGAAKVHLNIQLSADQQLVVFHDRALECRTNGHGLVSKHTLAQLAALDVGYGYQLQQQSGYPLRGKGVGLLQSLAQILAAYPDKAFVLNLKNSLPAAVDALVQVLQALPPAQQQLITVLADDTIVSALANQLPQQRRFSQGMAKSCFIQYALLGWSGYFPPVCRNTDLLIPASYGKYLWGWPAGFAARAQAQHSEVYLYQTNQPYRPAVDLRADGIGLFTGDIASASQATNAARPAASVVVGGRLSMAAWRGQAY